MECKLGFLGSFLRASGSAPRRGKNSPGALESHRAIPEQRHELVKYYLLNLPLDS